MPSKEILDAYEEYLRASVMPGNLERRYKMSEIRDRAKEKIANELPTMNLCETCKYHQVGNYTRKDCVTYGKRLCKYEEVLVDQILSIPELAVVDRKAELPENPYGTGVYLEAIIYDGLYRKRYAEAQQDMLKAGFKYKIIED